MVKLSVLDQSPIPKGKTAIEALADTRRLAQETEKMGYHRFWVSEHHYSKSLAGSSPEILISHLATITKRMRIGSGGVMLPHYSPYKVAENFKVLEGLYPKRIDVGLGRAPGGLPLSTRALQEGKHNSRDPYPEQLDDLITYLDDRADEQHRFPRLLATPIVESKPEVWLLGSSGGSAHLAARQGAGYAFAQFINGEGGEEVVQYYRDHFQPSSINSTPQTLLAIFVICAESEEEAERQASVLDLTLLLQQKSSSDSRGIPTIEDAERYPYSEWDRMVIRQNRQRMIVGNSEQVKERILQLGRAYSTNEFMLVSIIHDIEAKLRSYQLIAAAFQNDLQQEGIESLTKKE
ncbi:luciferase family oxidoreductase, group 1 [Marininema mesophilum]|uniref:Luciferase family oxidoreductase, group 1 n=1 Tax=Marininema mesophilum TaxID=1048340 RepID=A0A1H2VA63_9BACL|nr:LLM class flavin-dependent oxidoreductase [Marininema mesophilum]SDW65228.1 luciferase family oxidoreductase, group 1 [Marininema mesophilum]